MKHLVDDVRHVLGRLELDLPRPMQEVSSRELPRTRVLRVVLRGAVHGLCDREGEDAAGVRVHQRLSDVVLDGGVVSDAEADVDVSLARGVPFGDVDRAEREAVPHR